MIGAGGTQTAEFFRPGGTSEFDGVGMVGIVADLAAGGGADTAQRREHFGGDSLAVIQGTLQDSTEDGPFFLLMSGNEAAHLVDGFNGVHVAFALRVAPGKEAMATQNQAIGIGIFLYALFQHERQFETRALPRNPDDVAAEFLVELFHLAFAVGGSCHGDGPIGVEVVNVIPGEESVQRGIDGRRNFILAESGERIVGHHLVFKRFALVDGLELVEPIHVDQRETGFFDGADVAARTLHGQNLHGFACERVRHGDLGTGVATSEIRDAQVSAKKVGTVAKQRQFVGRKLFGLRIVPEIFQEGGIRG